MMERGKTVSVIIPVYNAERYLERCLDSVVNQSYRDLEIIIVNDGSTDRSADIIGACTDERLVVIDKRNGGVSQARNCGLERSSGEYVCFVDADDYVEPDYIEALVGCMTSRRCDLVCCGYQVLDPGGRRIDRFPKDGDRLHLSREGYLSGEEFFTGMLLHYSIGSTLWNKLFRRDLLSGLSFQTEITIGEDMLFLAEYADRCDSIYLTTRGLYGYTVNPAGAMKSIRQTAGFNEKWLSEWAAVCMLEAGHAGGGSLTEAILMYKKMSVANKILYKARKCAHWDESCAEMRRYVRANRMRALGNRFMNWKIKIKVFLY